MKKLMTGNEAIARGAYEAGVKYASAYPGTPSTEILENIALYKDDILAEWAPNEKVAVEAAVGASIAGARTVASMKHVGLNVAADPLFTTAYTGVNGGLIIITADEPGQHSSQNEQDNRNYAKVAKIPMLEPSNSQEAKDMFKEAFEISEKFDTPVLYRLTTRLCHSKSIVECEDRKEVGIKEYVKNAEKFVTVTAHSRVLRGKVEERLHNLEKFSNETNLNSIELNDSKIGVIASGMCINFAKEVFGNDASYLKLGFTFPMPDEKIKEFSSKVEKIYIIEENDEFIEEHVKALGIECHGKDVFPSYGEMTPDVIRKSVYGKTFGHLEVNEELIFEMDDFTEIEGYKAAKCILEKNNVSAFITTDDLLAFGVQNAIKEVGEDISVVGFNNIPLASYRKPSLSSVDINSEKLGFYAAKILIDKLEGKKNMGDHVIETKFIERESS